MTQDDLLTPSALARRLGVSAQTVGKWARQGRIPSVRISPKVRRFVYSDVLRAICREPSQRDALRVEGGGGSCEGTASREGDPP